MPGIRQVRLHVPIVTNDRVTFFVGGERSECKSGTSTMELLQAPLCPNDGDEPRTHLVMDLKVNDWLAQYFPKPDPWEQVEIATARATWPTFWKLRRVRVRTERQFWKHYEGSRRRRSCIASAVSTRSRHSPPSLGVRKLSALARRRCASDDITPHPAAARHASPPQAAADA